MLRRLISSAADDAAAAPVDAPVWGCGLLGLRSASQECRLPTAHAQAFALRSPNKPRPHTGASTGGAAASAADRSRRRSIAHVAAKVCALIP